MLRKYKIYSLLFASAMLGFTACEEQVEVGETLNVAPTVAPIAPGGIKVGTDDAVLTAAASDGTSTPLASGTLTLLDTDNNVLAEFTQTLSGTADTIRMDNSVSGLSARPEGEYKLVASATDNGGLTTLSADTATFEIFDLPFDANVPSLYILGQFTGWGDQPEEAYEDFTFELTGPNTWTINNVNVTSQFKFSVNFDFGSTDPNNEDFGDVDCDGFMESNINTEGGNGDTFCDFAGGTYNITFNDETLAYTMVNVDPPEQVLNSLHLLGTFNGFFGSEESAFRLDSSNYWVLDEILISPGDVFRFFENADGTGNAWGDDGADGTAGMGEGNIMLGMDMMEGFYKVEFNDLTLSYVLTFVRGLFPEELFLVGGSTPATWDANMAIPFMEVADGQFRIYAYIEVAGDGFKFLPQVGSFDGDLGMGSAAGELEDDGESNVTVASDGFYRVDVNFNDNTYAVTESNWAVTGAATPNGWPNDDPADDPIGTDHDMTLVSATKDNYSFTIDLDLVAGPIKFRENDAWDIDYGDTGADGTLEFKGDNIEVASDGNYTIVLNFDPDGYTYSLTLN